MERVGGVTVEVMTGFGLFEVTASETGVAGIRFPGSFRRLNVESEEMQSENREALLIAKTAADELKGYCSKSLVAFSVPVDWRRFSAFRKDVSRRLHRVPFGSTVTYCELASMSGHPGKARAVGNAVAANPVPVIVPCHRVVSAQGGTGGWSGPPGFKERLLIHEGIELKHHPQKED
jgi:methylated-DNA-[protein]-cysteine S-methyltransferase